MKRVNVKVVHYAPGRPGVSIDVEQELYDPDSDSWCKIAERETVETRQDALPAKWVDKDILDAVRDATVEVEPAVEASEGVEAKAAVHAVRFAGLTVVAE